MRLSAGKMVRPPPDFVARFLAEITPAARSVCPRYGIDPQACIDSAAACSRFGAAAAHFNYWNLPGRGDAGTCVILSATRHAGIAGGGVAPQVVRLARFRSPASAVEAWCRLAGRP